MTINVELKRDPSSPENTDMVDLVVDGIFTPRIGASSVRIRMIGPGGRIDTYDLYVRDTLRLRLEERR